MTSVATVIAVATVYVGVLFVLAVWAERQERRGRRVASNPLVYSLSLAVYCTTWTYYGSVGLAASSGLLFLGVYLGPTLAAIFWWQVLRKMVRIKDAHRVTSVVDLLSLRFGKSQSLAAAATIALLFGLIPYISLQLKTMIATVGLLTGHDGSRTYPMGTHVGLPIVFLMIVFTIVFGIRRLSPTERHPGMMVALAAESVVKLAGVVAAGAFVVFGLFHGFGDVFRRAGEAGVVPDLLGKGGGVATWLSHVLTSIAAILFLPRQFHVAVVENSNEKHIRTATWLFPLYMLAITFFVVPLALGGLLLRPAGSADWFVLSLPHAAGARWLTWLVFLGGFSAGTSMVMAETMALATMVSNHLFLPALGMWGPLGRLRRHLLGARWWAAALVVFAAFAYERAFGSQYELVSIGLISFSAIFMLSLPILGGLYWRGASTAGALAGLAAGFAAWVYTLVVPVWTRAGWLPTRLLTEGPAGIFALRPEALFGLAGLDRIPHAVFWILFFGLGAFVLGSLAFPASAEEQARAARLAELPERPAPDQVETGRRPLADAAGKRGHIVRLFAQYHGEAAAERLAEACLEKVGAAASGQLSALQLASLEAEVETTLASFIGTAAAHAALKRQDLVTAAEARAISTAYAEILAVLKVPPAELRRKIDYHRERERLLAHEAQAQRFLSSVSERLAASLDVEETGQTVVRLMVPHLVDAALLWIAFDDRKEPRAWFADGDPERERKVLPALQAALPAIQSHACVSRAMASGRPVVNPVEPDGAWPADLFDGRSCSGEVTFPLLAGGRPLGTLTFFLTERSRFRACEDLALGEELAHRSVMALANAALFQSAEEAVHARDEFLAVASHELKTPLTPLRLSIQALQRLAARDERAGVPRRALDHALQGADLQIGRLVSFVDDLLDVSRITTRRLRLDLESMDLGSAVRDVVERHRMELTRANCSIRLAIGSEVLGRWDRLRIEQVCTNLLTNAMKYAPGPIEVSVESVGATARLVVRDQGPGIAPEDLERIFLPFERAVSYLRASGFGLGLYIVRQIVEAHGGVARLDSAPGRGSTFAVELPRNPPASA